MFTNKDLFKTFQAQTFPYPSCLEIKSKATSEILIIKNILILSLGVSANTLGHSNPIINNAG